MRTGRPMLAEPPHGTRRRYQLRRDPCRCDECRAANALYARLGRCGEQLEIPADAYEHVGGR